MATMVGANSANFPPDRLELGLHWTWRCKNGGSHGKTGPCWAEERGDPCVGRG
ncbi:hypothetical protein BDR22DRAFT_847440 [Usnea florida]